MSYTIRNKEGMLIARVEGSVANNIMSQSPGFWRSHKTTNHTGSCFELTEDGCFTLRPNFNSVLRVFLWSGYIIIPENS